MMRVCDTIDVTSKVNGKAEVSYEAACSRRDEVEELIVCCSDG